MDSEVRIYLQRAENEFRIARASFSISENRHIKSVLELDPEDTFYSAVISHSYFSIFYAAKTILLSIGVKTESPEVHRKTFNEFKKHLVDTGKLDVELLKIYRNLMIKADDLLGIFRKEKWKRGHFTYQTIPEDLYQT